MVTVQSGGGRLATAAIEPDGRIALTLYDVATGNLESTGFWARKFETDSWRVDGVVPG